MKEWTPSVPLKGEEVDKKRKSEIGNRKSEIRKHSSTPSVATLLVAPVSGGQSKQKSESRNQKSKIFCS